MDAKFWRSIDAKIERWHPLVISAAFVCIAVKLHDTYPIPVLNKEVLAATINISTITIGFLSATQSILVIAQPRKNQGFSQ